MGTIVNLSEELRDYLNLRASIQHTIQQVVLPAYLETLQRDHLQTVKITGEDMFLILMYAGPQQFGVFRVQPDGQRLVFVYHACELTRHQNPILIFTPM